MPRPLLLALAVVLSLAANLGQAQACACCTNLGQRNVGTRPLDSGKHSEIASLRFHAEAQLYTGEGDVEAVRGIATPAGSYELHVAQEGNRWTFDFRDKAGRTGALSLALPANVSVFEVDPRVEQREGGTGPSLYKEWTLTGRPAGTGIFADGLRGGARLSLILQGHGNSCTSAIDFSHWTLTVAGPKAAYTFIGELVK